MYTYKEFTVDNKLEITSLYTMFRHKYGEKYAFAGEVHDFAELVCVTEGKVGVTADDTAFSLSAGQMIIHTPNEFHRIWAVGEKFEIIIISFKAVNLSGFGGVYSLNPQKLAELISIYEDATKIFDYCADKYEIVKLKGSETEASMLIKRLEFFLLSALDSKGKYFTANGAENYTRIMSAMEKLLTSQAGIKDIADECKVSVSTVEKTMRLYTGRGAMTHFNHLKMNRACELLHSGNSVKQTAYTLGYNDPNYFSSVFKKIIGCPPSKYK